MEEAVVVPKKKPGRPKKPVVIRAVPINGIVQAPDDPGDLAGVMYSNPAMFKKIFHLFKQYASSEIHILWDRTGIEFAAVDHLMKSNIRVRIDGARTNLYYCAEPIKICLRRGSLDPIANTIGKTHSKINIVLRRDERVSMILTLENNSFSNRNNHTIDVMPMEIAEMPQIHDDIDYPIKFHFATAHFKLLISNARKMGKEITFEKVGNGPLRLATPDGDDVRWEDIYDTPEKIGLVSTIDDDYIFIVSVAIDYIKPFSSNVISDTVFIAAHPEKEMSFTLLLDKGPDGVGVAVVKVFTEIKSAPQFPDDPIDGMF